MITAPPAQRSHLRSLAVYAIVVSSAYVVPGALTAFGAEWMILPASLGWVTLSGPGLGVAAQLAGPRHGLPEQFDTLMVWGIRSIPLTSIPVYFVARAVTRHGRIVACAMQVLLFDLGWIAYLAVYAGYAP